MKTSEQKAATPCGSISLTGSVNPKLGPPTFARRTARLCLALTAALGTSTATVHAQGWETIDDILPPAIANGVVADGSGNVFVGGSTTDTSGTPHTIVMRSSDQGSTWMMVDDVESKTTTHPLAPMSIASVRVTTDGIGFEDRLVTTSQTGDDKWLTRMSLDAGATWTSMDHYAHPNSNYLLSSPSGLALDAAGNIYVSGYATETVVTGNGRKTTTSTIHHSLIRKFESGVWRTITPTVGVGSIVCGGSDLFGRIAANGSWLVIKSTDGGETWTTIDTFRYDASGSTVSWDIAADNFGNVVVVGYGARKITTGTGKNATTKTHQYWITRVGTGGGTAWVTSDVFELGIRPNGYPALNKAQAAVIDSVGNVHVTGYGCGENNVRRWITRTLSVSTGWWSTTDDYTHTPGTWTEGDGIAADLSGRLYSTGYGNASSWLVRRKTAP